VADRQELLDMVEQYRTGLKQVKKTKDPLKWADIQNNLAVRLRQLAEEGDRELFREAEVACRKAVGIYNRTRNPARWADAWVNMGNILYGKGHMGDDEAALAKASEAYEHALEVYTLENDRDTWSRLMSNVAMARGRRAVMVGSAEAYLATARTLRSMLTVITHDVQPDWWASLNYSLADALLMSQQFGGCDVELLAEASEALENCLSLWTREELPLNWAQARQAQGGVALTLGQAMNDADRLREAERAYADALEAYRTEDVPGADMQAERMLKQVRELLGAF
jgi:tetratricopeptide (TPR) repeat protein